MNLQLKYFLFSSLLQKEGWLSPAYVGVDEHGIIHYLSNEAPTEAVAIEVKSHLTQDVVDEFLENLALFKQAFPAYKNYQIYGAVAGIEIDEGVDRYGYKKGLFVIRQSGEAIEIANDNQFKPAVW